MGCVAARWWSTAGRLGWCVASRRLVMGGSGAGGRLDACSSSECRMGCAMWASHTDSFGIHWRRPAF